MFIRALAALKRSSKKKEMEKKGYNLGVQTS